MCLVTADTDGKIIDKYAWYLRYLIPAKLCSRMPAIRHFLNENLEKNKNRASFCAAAGDRGGADGDAVLTLECQRVARQGFRGNWHPSTIW